MALALGALDPEVFKPTEITRANRKPIVVSHPDYLYYTISTDRDMRASMYNVLLQTPRPGRDTLITAFLSFINGAFDISIESATGLVPVNGPDEIVTDIAELPKVLTEQMEKQYQPFESHQDIYAAWVLLIVLGVRRRNSQYWTQVVSARQKALSSAGVTEFPNFMAPSYSVMRVIGAYMGTEPGFTKALVEKICLSSWSGPMEGAAAQIRPILRYSGMSHIQLINTYLVQPRHWLMMSSRIVPEFNQLVRSLTSLLPVEARRRPYIKLEQPAMALQIFHRSFFVNMTSAAVAVAREYDTKLQNYNGGHPEAVDFYSKWVKAVTQPAARTLTMVGNPLYSLPHRDGEDLIRMLKNNYLAVTAGTVAAGDQEEGQEQPPGIMAD